MFFDTQPICVKVIEPASSNFDWSLLLSILAIIGAIISFFVTQWKWKNEFSQKEKSLKKMIENEQNKIHQDNSKLLLQKRMEIYPELWEIVSSIYGFSAKHLGDEKIKLRNKDCLFKMRQWRKKHGIFLSSHKKTKEEPFIRALQSYYILEKVLKIPVNFTKYREEKLKAIDRDKESFLRYLKADLDILDYSEAEVKNLTQQC